MYDAHAQITQRLQDLGYQSKAGGRKSRFMRRLNYKYKTQRPEWGPGWSHRARDGEPGDGTGAQPGAAARGLGTGGRALRPSGRLVCMAWRVQKQVTVRSDCVTGLRQGKHAGDKMNTWGRRRAVDHVTESFWLRGLYLML